MPRSGAFDQISRQPNGSSVGVWGRYLLRSAFQPIYAFSAGKLEIAAYEGLIRPFEDGKPVSPGEFFGSIKPIDRFRVETLTRNLHVLNAAMRLGPDSSLFLNFDPSVFLDATISNNALRDLKLVLHESGLDPARVVCELTEQRSGSMETLLGFVAALRANGFRIALDDYGADESDFTRVKDIRPDIVKFDGAWIDQLMGSAPGAALLAAMVKTFTDMGIESVFEGLEEPWQLELAEKCQVHMVQGYVLARPELIPIESGRSHEVLGAAAAAPTPAGNGHGGAAFGKGARPFGRRVSES